MVTRLRQTVRGVCIREDYKIALNLVSRDDIFGKASYYELPGGGVQDGEDVSKALEREIREELGWRGSSIRCLCEIWDFYYPIRQENHTQYYLFRLTEDTGVKNLDSMGDLLIDKTLFVTFDEAIDLYENQPDTAIGNLVRNRELQLLKAFKDYSKYRL